MKKAFLFCVLLMVGSHAAAQPRDYEWTTPSRNSSESMPCGGGDVGMNVWVEQGDVLFYLSRSGCFDENNTLLKLGRFRISLSPGLDMKRFRQILHLNDGYVEVTDGSVSLQLWADVQKPVVHIDMNSPARRQVMAVTYESWRTHDRELTKRERFQTSYKFAAPKGLKTRADSVSAGDQELTFLHRNGAVTVFDATVAQQRMETVKHRLYNPLEYLVFGGRMKGRGFVLVDKMGGRYASSDYEGWMYVSRRARKRQHMQVALATKQGTVAEWEQELDRVEQSVQRAADRQATRGAL